MKKFRIPSIPPTTNKSIRFPNDVIEEIEAAIKGTDCKFSAILFHAAEEAIQALDAQNYGLAKQILIDGEQAAENSFVAKNE